MNQSDGVGRSFVGKLHGGVILGLASGNLDLLYFGDDGIQYGNIGDLLPEKVKARPKAQGGQQAEKSSCQPFHPIIPFQIPHFYHCKAKCRKRQEKEGIPLRESLKISINIIEIYKEKRLEKPGGK